MAMTPALSKLTLTTHITSSVGWFGSVAGFLVLSIAGFTSSNDQMVRASYLAMELTAWFIIVPLSLASPVSGILQALGTTWGLFRYYWVSIKFLITIPATILLLVHLQPIGHLAQVVSETTLASGELAGTRIQLIANAAAAAIVLLIATALSVYKPFGLTAYGQRKRQIQNTTSQTSRNRWAYVLGIMAILLIIAFIVIHLAGGGLGGH